MPGTLQETSAAPFVPQFGLTQPERTDWRHWSFVGGVSLLAHIFLALGARTVFQIPMNSYTAPRIALEQQTRRVTPLVAPPPSMLTQRAPNQNKVTPEFNISALPPRAAQPNLPASPGAAALPRQKFTLPDRKVPAGAPTMAPDAPQLDTAQLRPNLPVPALGSQILAPPPPQIQTTEKPKLAFERPGTDMGVRGGVAPIQVPRHTGTVEEASRSAARSTVGRGLVVGDEDASAPGINPSSPSVPIPGKLGSAVELLSDPQGADFWPYLVKVLASVRRNWFAVIPESARYGRPGRTAIQFAINKDGTVAKLVIAAPSGAEALDRAAVAGISASNPFPPLPVEFKGTQVRLQFVFKYNVK